MDDESLVNESSDEMEVSPENSDQDKSEEDSTTLGNPVLPSMRQEGSNASSPQVLTVDQHDATRLSIDSQQNLLNEERDANTHLSITSKASLANLSKDSMTQKDSSRDLDSSSVLPDTPECVPGSSKVTGIPTHAALGLNIDPTSNPQHYSIEDYEPNSEMETEEIPCVKSEKAESISSVADADTEMQMLQSSRSSCITENPHLLVQSGSSTVNNSGRDSEFKAHDSEKEEVRQNPTDSLKSKPKIEPGSELKESNEYSNPEVGSISLSGNVLGFLNLPKVQNPNMPIQDYKKVDFASLVARTLRSMNLSKLKNSEGPAQGKSQHMESISISRQASELGVDANPTQPGVHETGSSSRGQASTPRNQPEGARDLNPTHEEQRSTSSHRPVITKCTSGTENDPSGDSPERVTNAVTNDRNTSSEGVSKHTFMAQILLLTILGEIMEATKEVEEFEKFYSHFAIIHRCPCDEKEKLLQLDLAAYLARRKAAFKAENEDSYDDSLEFRVKKIVETLTRIVVTALIYTVSVWSTMKLDEIMINYTAFKSLYENCCGIWTHEKIREIQDKKSRKRVANYSKTIERLLLQTKAAFQLLLMHIGKYADQRFVEKNIKLLFEDHVKYLRRRIEKFEETSSVNLS